MDSATTKKHVSLNRVRLRTKRSHRSKNRHSLLSISSKAISSSLRSLSPFHHHHHHHHDNHNQHDSQSPQTYNEDEKEEEEDDDDDDSMYRRYRSSCFIVAAPFFSKSYTIVC